MAVQTDRTLLPDVTVKQAVESCGHQLNDMCETLLLRVKHLPDTIKCECDDAQHVWADGSTAIENSLIMLKKLIPRDVTRFGSLKFLYGPTTSVSARVFLLETYTWAAFCLLGFCTSQPIGAWGPLKSSLSPIFCWVSSPILFFMLPCYVYARLRKAHWPDDEQRRFAFYASVLYGIVGAYAFGMPSARFAQFVSLVPLWIGTVSAVTEFYPIDRSAFVCYCVGIPFVIYAAYAIYALKTIHVLAWAMFCGVVAVDLQLKLGRVQRGWAGKEIEQWATTAVMCTAHFALNHEVGLVAGNETVQK